MKRLLSFLFVVLSFSVCTSQTAYKLKTELNEGQKKELLKHADSLFFATPNLEFNISTYDIMRYSDIKEDETLKPGYLEGQLKKLLTDPKLSYIYNNNIGTYYNNKGDTAKAKSYFTASLNEIKEEGFKKNPSQFFSFRGILKFNLKQGGTEDLEKALSINPNDSIAILFYPMFLINTQQGPRAEQLLIKSLQDKNAAFKPYSYLFLCFTKVYGIMAEFMALDEQQQKDFSNRDPDKILNFDEYDKYIDLKNPDFYRIKQMAEIYSAFFKFMPGMREDKVDLSATDIAFFNAKEKYFTDLLPKKNQNLYALYRTLGIMNVLQKKYDVALNYYSKAVASFPVKKEKLNFNTIEAQSNIAFTEYLKKNYTKAIEAYRKALDVKAITMPAQNEIGLDIASLYFESGNLAAAESALLPLTENDFDANLMSAYISFLRQYPLAADTYLAKAQKLIDNENNMCRLLTLVAVLNIYHGNADNARVLFNENKSLFVEISCEDCEKILDKYLVANK